MTTILRKTVAARDLPASRQQEGRFTPDQRVSVTVEPAPPVETGTSPLDYLGAGRGLFADASQIDRHLREQRDAWD